VHFGQQVTEAAAEHLKASGVTVKPYDDVLDEVRALGSAGKKLWVDPAQVCIATRLSANLGPDPPCHQLYSSWSRCYVDVG